jgi:tRNA(fMet)-specific endonuclease VapC
VKERLEADLLLRFQGRILDITLDVMLIWGELTGRLEKEGRSIKPSMASAGRPTSNIELPTSNSHAKNLVYFL